ncbi:hypothetical protein AURDEDRAFT_171293 [Auricularia subglabra TFB-10046 SS5]|nr:hypothetical protein AURDEDRAFT_171293 [Auricularia subglabra TFB-10046 SS5]
MFHFSVKVRLDLRFPEAVDRNGERLHLYFSSLRLDDGTNLDFAVSRAVDKNSAYPPRLYKHGTRAQVLGDADLVGTSFFISNASIIESDDAPTDPVQPLLSVVFRGFVFLSHHTIFRTYIDADKAWPPKLRARCAIEGGSPHTEDYVELTTGTTVNVSGLITGMVGDDPWISVHDVRTDGSEPCPAGGLRAEEGVAGLAFCQWVATHDSPTARLPEKTAPSVQPVVLPAPAVVPSGPAAHALGSLDVAETGERTDASTPTNPAPPSPAYASASPAMLTSPVCSCASPELESLGYSPVPPAQAPAASPSSSLPVSVVPAAAVGPGKAQHLPPSPGPTKRSYWQWYELRVTSASF